jgi:hypothetical protein
MIFFFYDFVEVYSLGSGFCFGFSRFIIVLTSAFSLPSAAIAPWGWGLIAFALLLIVAVVVVLVLQARRRGMCGMGRTTGPDYIRIPAHEPNPNVVLNSFMTDQQ